MGCIHRLKVGRRPIDFEEKDPLINSFHKVSQCPLISRTGRLTTTPIYVPETSEEEEDGDGEHIQEIRKPHHKSHKNRNHIENNNDNVASSSNSLPIGDGGESAKKNPCSSKNPCLNNGLCWGNRGHSSGYKCVCHPEYSGKRK